MNKFYLSDEWTAMRIDLIMVRGNRCEACGKDGNSKKVTIQAHHLTYERFGGDEEPDDLILLCKTCHEKEHGIQKLDKADRQRNGTSEKRREKKKLKKARRKKVKRHSSDPWKIFYNKKLVNSAGI